MNKLVALVPMRHNSERVPGKNYRDFAGKPLYHRVVDALLGSGEIDKVVIDTDSLIILEDAEKNYPDVVLLKRPEHLTDGAIPMNDVILNVMSQIDSEIYLQTHSTNPLLTAKTVRKSIQTFRNNHPVYDSLFTVTQLQTRLWDSLGRAVNHNPNILLRTQDLPPIFEENSCLYIFTKEIIKRKHNRIGDRPLLFPISAEEAQDIDVELDFRIAEFLFNEREKIT